jgi:hypothetical protein
MVGCDALDVGSGVLGAAVQGHRDGGEPVLAQFLV